MFFLLPTVARGVSSVVATSVAVASTGAIEAAVAGSIGGIATIAL